MAQKFFFCSCMKSGFYFNVKKQENFLVCVAKIYGKMENFLLNFSHIVKIKSFFFSSAPTATRNSFYQTATLWIMYIFFLNYKRTQGFLTVKKKRKLDEEKYLKLENKIFPLTKFLILIKIVPRFLKVFVWISASWWAQFGRYHSRAGNQASSKSMKHAKEMREIWNASKKIHVFGIFPEFFKIFLNFCKFSRVLEILEIFKNSRISQDEKSY